MQFRHYSARNLFIMPRLQSWYIVWLIVVLVLPFWIILIAWDKAYVCLDWIFLWATRRVDHCPVWNSKIDWKLAATMFSFELFYKARIRLLHILSEIDLHITDKPTSYSRLKYSHCLIYGNIWSLIHRHYHRQDMTILKYLLMPLCCSLLVILRILCSR